MHKKKKNSSAPLLETNGNEKKTKTNVETQERKKKELMEMKKE